MIVPSMVAKRGDESMRTDRVPFKASPVGVALLVFPSLPERASPRSCTAMRRWPYAHWPGCTCCSPFAWPTSGRRRRSCALGNTSGCAARGCFITAESTLTRDTVPVNVDAIVFWMGAGFQPARATGEVRWPRLSYGNQKTRRLESGPLVYSAIGRNRAIAGCTG